MTYLGLQQYANEVLERFSLIERAFFGNNCDIQVYETETMETEKLLLSMLYMPQPSCKHPTFVAKAPKPVEHTTVIPKWANCTKCQPNHEYDSQV